MSDLGTIQEAVDALDLDLDALNEQMTCLFDEIRMILLDPEPVSTEQAEVPLSASASSSLMQTVLCRRNRIQTFTRLVADVRARLEV